MSPRPRKASDDQVFAAASRVMSRVGPTQLTLADIAAEVGLTAGALVQRFGSKRGLLLAIAERGAQAAHATFAELRDAHRSPLAALRAYADCFAGMADSPGALAHQLAYLQIDLTDPEFHRHTLAMAEVTTAALGALLDAAVDAGELTPGVDTTALARTLQALLSGSLMTWAFYRDRPAGVWVREDLDMVLRPLTRVAAARRRRPPARKPGRR